MERLYGCLNRTPSWSAFRHMLDLRFWLVVYVLLLARLDYQYAGEAAVIIGLGYAIFTSRFEVGVAALLGLLSVHAQGAFVVACAVIIFAELGRSWSMARVLGTTASSLVRHRWVMTVCVAVTFLIGDKLT